MFAAPCDSPKYRRSGGEGLFGIFASGAVSTRFPAVKPWQRGYLRTLRAKWARLSGPDPKTGVESYGGDTGREYAPAPQAVTIATPAPLTADFRQHCRWRQLHPDLQFRRRRDLLRNISTLEPHSGGTRSRLGQGWTTPSSSSGSRRCRSSTGLVQIYRPSPDILVLTRDQRLSLILAAARP